MAKVRSWFCAESWNENQELMDLTDLIMQIYFQFPEHAKSCDLGFQISMIYSISMIWWLRINNQRQQCCFHLTE